MEVHIIHTRHPDYECGIEVFVDGEKVSDDDIKVYDFDPGAGHTTEDFEDNMAQDVARAPDFLRGRIEDIYASWRREYERWGV